MALHPALLALIDAGAHGHLVTINPDGSPQVSVVWLGHDGDDLLVAHLGQGQKMRNIERDPRVAVSFVGTGRNGAGLLDYAIVHGIARLTDGGGRELLADLAPRFLGIGATFPPMPDPPPGRIIHITPERIGGSGPWVG